MRFKILIPYFFCIIPFVSFTQSKELGEKYKNETKKIVSYILEDEIKIVSKTVLINKASIYDLKDCFETIFINSKELTEKDKSDIKIEIPIEFNWTNEYIENVKIIENSEFQKIFEDHKNGWENFRKLHGESILKISRPIFLRNYSICIISYSLTYDSLGGFGYTTCYRKENGKWKAFGTSCGWDS